MKQNQETTIEIVIGHRDPRETMEEESRPANRNIEIHTRAVKTRWNEAIAITRPIERDSE